jgi:fibronectin type 3 domain-containing protein
MRNSKYAVLVSALLLTCSINTQAVNPTNPPPSVTLAWDQSPSSTNYVIGSYNLYYGPASGVYTNRVSVLGVTNTTNMVTNLVRGATYYFAATAVATNGLESDYSNEVFTKIATIPASPVNLRISKLEP